MNQWKNAPILLIVIWIAFMLEMVLHSFPNKHIPQGCRKGFVSGYQPSGQAPGVLRPRRFGISREAWVLIAWVLANLGFWALYWKKIIDADALLLLTLFYACMDTICVLFFCPFQVLFMRNRCCVNCTIYQWGYVMMFLPLLMIPNLYSWTLFGMSLVMFLRWEWTVYRHPERFSEQSNLAIRCSNCHDKLCQQRKALHPKK